MNFIKVSFHNKNQQKLQGRLELPANRHPHNYVIFAHCFTGNKNFSSVIDISRALSAQGYGVLRFDFTGLGESGGEFKNTDFSHNIDDLVAAADFLSEHYRSPTLLVGHSLGGTAAIYASKRIKSIKAIAVIGSPADPDHVKHLLKNDLEAIQQTGKAVVNVGGRDFTIQKSFLDDLDKKTYDEILQLQKPLLIFHSPQDKIVPIEHAEILYKTARHPKSFVSLDGADHLLSNEKPARSAGGDAEYAGNVCASWALRYLEFQDEEKLQSKHEVVVSLDKKDGFTTKMKLGSHYLTADEPESFGGNDFGPNPYELVSGGLSACTAMTIQLYSKRKKWKLENVEVHTNYNKAHQPDCENCEKENAHIETFDRNIRLEGDLSEKQQQKLLEIAEKCPVHKTLSAKVNIKSKLI